MTEDRNNRSCQEFQEHLADLIASGEDVSKNPHLQTCANCRALLADLETIAEAARQLFPVVDPPDSVWKQIESRLKEQDGEADRG